MTELLLGLDIGTASAKGVLLTADGVVVASAGSASYPLHRPRAGWVEQDPADWWGAACSVIQKLVGERRSGDRVAAVAVSGQGCACTLVDVDGTVLRPALTWLDTRASAETDEMAAAWAPAVEALNGNAIGAYNVEPKLRWLINHEPETVARAAYTLTTTAYVTRCLTDRVVMNHADGGILFAYDAARRDWSHSLLRNVGLPGALYPPLYPCTEVIGQVTRAAADATGLAMGIPVVAGGEDTPSAALSMGVSRPGDTFLSLGTAAVVGVCLSAGQRLREPRLLSYPHVLPELSITSGSMSSAGGAVEWLMREFGPAYGSAADGYTALNQAVAGSEPGAGGLIFLPYLSGELHPILDAHARGVFVGLSGATTRGDIARALLEGSAMAIRHNLTVAAGAGARIKRLVATGGPTRSAEWRQIIADVTGQPLSVVASGGAPVGDALLAGAGVGLITDPGATARAMATIEREYIPRPAAAARYDDMFPAYLRIYERLAPEFIYLAGLPQS